jgi:hypothetical protein
VAGVGRARPAASAAATTALLASVLAACTSGVPPTASLAAASSQPAAQRWTVVDVDLAGGQLTDVGEIDGSLVAVGSTGSSPLVFVSTDGVDWTRVPDQPAFATRGGAGMTGLTRWQDWLVAVGAGDAESVVWRTKDARTWEKTYETRPRTQAEIDGGVTVDGAMYRVVSSGTELVAVGSSVGGLVDDFGGAAWTSSDGTAWVAAPASIQLSRAPIFDVAILEGGTYVAVGGVRGAVSLISGDGVDWTLHEQRDVVSEGRLFSIASGTDSRLVAIGDEAGRGVSATSADGALWARGVCTGALTGALLYTVAALGRGFVAGGEVGGRAAVWVSQDGARWTRVRGEFGEGRITSVFVHDGSVVAVGSGIWVGPPDAIGDAGLYPETGCGAPNPDQPLPEPSTADSSPGAPGEPAPAEPPSEAPAAPATGPVQAPAEAPGG